MSSERLCALFESLLTREQYGHSSQFRNEPGSGSDFQCVELVPIAGACRVPEENENRLKLASQVLQVALLLKQEENGRDVAENLGDLLKGLDRNQVKVIKGDGNYL